jgi:hypothetical protein
MPFKNKIRLRLMIGKPQFPDDRNVFRLADGTKKVQSIVVRKTYLGVTDYYPEWVHQRLKIALSHDTVNIESDKYLGGVSVDGDYEIDWVDFKDYPYGQANFKLEVTPFDATNSNCQTCDESTQLNLVDDRFTEELDQSTEYTLNLFDNDSINCSPITVSITYTNAVFVESATIDEVTGVLTLFTKPLFFQRNTEKILTYRVTCSNGGYDEADVYADLIGEDAACLEPTNLEVSILDYNAGGVNWTAPDPAPDAYEWQIAEEATPATIVDSGTVVSTAAESLDLEPATNYIFSVRSQCGSNYSQWVNIHLTTLVLEETCGRYTVEIFGDDPQAGRDITYIACNNDTRTTHVFPFRPRNICVLQTAPGTPVSIIGADQITYMRPC